MIAEATGFHTSKELLKQTWIHVLFNLLKRFHTSKELLKPVEFKRNYTTNTI